MTPKTPLKSDLLHDEEGESYVSNRLDIQAWRKTLDFSSPPKTEEQAIFDVLAREEVKDRRDNRSPELIGTMIEKVRADWPNVAFSGCADKVLQ
jgi:hypothetical protein